MDATTSKAGFFGTATATYYRSANGQAYYASADFAGIRPAAEIPVEATPIDHMMTPEEMSHFLTQVKEAGYEIEES